MKNKSSNKKLIIGLIALVALIGVFAIVYNVFRPKPTEGSKSITINVVNSEEKTTSYSVKTDAEYLRQAMEEAQGLTFSEEEDSFGPMVTTVNGEYAKWGENNAYWSFYVNGDYANYGISEQPVNDGDEFSIVYTLAE